MDSLDLARRAEALVDAGRAADALRLAGDAARRAPLRAEGHAARARALRASGRPQDALAALDALVVCAPDSAPAHDARGVLLTEAGRIVEARAAFATAIACDPAFARAHFGLAMLGRVAPDELAVMEALAAEPETLDEEGRLFLLYALARAYDEADDLEHAFLAAEGGARLRRARWPGNAETELARLAGAAPRASPAPDLGDATDRIVFVFGLPRSGTTLVEQILAHAPGVVALGETELFAREAMLRVRPADVARAYLDALPPATRYARRVVDKSLGNVLHIGAIRAAFPNAKLVNVTRDPLDVGLSCHFAYFQHDLPFPPELAAFGRYARAHGALTRAWGAASPARIWREQSYEALVADAEGEARALFMFLGLAFDARVLDLAERPREVRTASLAQVREAPHARSVGRWRRYADYLEPLRRALGGVDAPC